MSLLPALIALAALLLGGFGLREMLRSDGDNDESGSPGKRAKAGSGRSDVEPGGSPGLADPIRRAWREEKGDSVEYPKVDLPEPFGKLTPEQYRDIRFRPEQALWRGEKLEAEVQLFPLGWI